MCCGVNMPGPPSSSSLSHATRAIPQAAAAAAAGSDSQEEERVIVALAVTQGDMDLVANFACSLRYNGLWAKRAKSVLVFGADEVRVTTGKRESVCVCCCFFPKKICACMYCKCIPVSMYTYIIASPRRSNPSHTHSRTHTHQQM